MIIIFYLFFCHEKKKFLHYGGIKRACLARSMTGMLKCNMQAETQSQLSFSLLTNQITAKTKWSLSVDWDLGFTPGSVNDMLKTSESLSIGAPIL